MQNLEGKVAVAKETSWHSAINFIAIEVFAWSPRRLEYLLEDIGAEAGLTKHLSFDMCRWTCALRDYQSGMESDLVRQKLGVSKIQWRELFIKIKKLNGELK